MAANPPRDSMATHLPPEKASARLFFADHPRVALIILRVVLARVTYKAAGFGSAAICGRRLHGRATRPCGPVAAVDAPAPARPLEK